MTTTMSKSIDERIRQAERDGDHDLARHLRRRAGHDPAEVRRYDVLAINMTALHRKVEALAKRITRRGGRPLQVHEVSRRWEQRGDGSVQVVTVEVVGDVPDNNGWRFCAVLHHRKEGAVIQRAPGAVLNERELEDFRLRGPVCDHCNVRRKRNDTYVLRNVDTTSDAHGQQVQVGRNCLQDFTGVDPRAAIYAFNADAQLTEALRKFNELDDTVKDAFGAPTLIFLAELIRRERHGTPAHELVGDAWRRAAQFRHRPRPGINPSRPTHTDAVAAARMLRDLRTHLVPTIPTLEPSDKDHNLGVVVAENYIEARHAAIAARALRWHRRHLRDNQSLADRLGANPMLSDRRTGDTFLFTAEQLVELVSDRDAMMTIRQAAQEDGDDDAHYVGEDGERVEVLITVVDQGLTPRMTTWTHGVTERGKGVTIFARRGMLADTFERGQRLQVRGICDRRIYKGKPETVLKRAWLVK